MPSSGGEAPRATHVGYARFGTALVAGRPAASRSCDRSSATASRSHRRSICWRSTAVKHARSPTWPAARRRRPGHRMASASPSRAPRAPDDPPHLGRAAGFAGPRSDVRVITSAVYRANGGGWNDPDRPAHIWVTDVPSSAEIATAAATHPRQVSRKPGTSGRHDGHRIFFTSTGRRTVLPAEGLGSVRACLLRAAISEDRQHQRQHQQHPPVA